MIQVVVPMSGEGSRFKRAGYADIKPLIKVMGKPIIEWVCSLYDDEVEFIFICREDHLETTDLRSELGRIKPTGRIISIPGHKLGPVYAVTKAYDHIIDEAKVIVNYCDFFMQWNFRSFMDAVKERDYDGAIPCYTGFHPHLLHSYNKYAVCAMGKRNELLDIREKHRFHEDPRLDNHSAGTYYFKSGRLLKEIFTRMLDRSDLQLNGEFYVSLVYRLLLEDERPILVYNKIEKFCQWGTPEDLSEFLDWKRTFDLIDAFNASRANHNV